ncbi:hypothetical protein DMA10_16635 [Streptomyces sp. WAC 01420]|nr:hypothetical protein DMA10_16635 [Streptomyces sp. WAC 01420]
MPHEDVPGTPLHGHGRADRPGCGFRAAGGGTPARGGGNSWTAKTAVVGAPGVPRPELPEPTKAGTPTRRDRHARDPPEPAHPEPARTGTPGPPGPALPGPARTGTPGTRRNPHARRPPRPARPRPARTRTPGTRQNPHARAAKAGTPGPPTPGLPESAEAGASGGVRGSDVRPAEMCLRDR